MTSCILSRPFNSPFACKGVKNYEYLDARKKKLIDNLISRYINPLHTHVVSIDLSVNVSVTNRVLTEITEGIGPLSNHDQPVGPGHAWSFP